MAAAMVIALWRGKGRRRSYRPALVDVRPEQRAEFRYGMLASLSDEPPPGADVYASAFHHGYHLGLALQAQPIVHKPPRRARARLFTLWGSR
jgi:hypothetical protein